MHGFAWTYSHPAATFADALLVDGRHTGARVVRHRRSLPADEQRPGEPWRTSEPYYVGIVAGEPLPGEHVDLAEAHRAVEAAVITPSTRAPDRRSVGP